VVLVLRLDDGGLLLIHRGSNDNGLVDLFLEGGGGTDGYNGFIGCAGCVGRSSGSSNLEWDHGSRLLGAGLDEGRDYVEQGSVHVGSLGGVVGLVGGLGLGLVDVLGGIDDLALIDLLFLGLSRHLQCQPLER